MLPPDQKPYFEQPYLDKVLEHLPSQPSILDLGCGTGEPMAHYFLAAGCKLTGIDASSKQLEKAKNMFPEVEFILADMRCLQLNKQFDAIIAWHSFFHLPKEDQMNMFKIFATHIKPGGMLLFTTGP